MSRFASEPSKGLLPDGPGAWVLHVVTTGGFIGQGLPTITIRSTGDFACGDNESLSFGPLNPSAFQPFWQHVTRADLKVDRSSPRAATFIPYTCSDCYITSVYLTRRETDEKVRFYGSNSEKMKYAAYADIFDGIKRQSAELVSCGN